MSRESSGEIYADNTFRDWMVTNLLSSPAVAETHPKIHVKLAPHLRKVSIPFHLWIKTVLFASTLCIKNSREETLSCIHPILTTTP